MKMFVAGCALLAVLAGTPTATAVVVHPVFASWQDYRTYFKGMRKHTGWKKPFFYAYKEEGIWYFHNKKNKKCKL